MDTQILQNLQNKILDIEKNINNINSKISSFDIDKQFYIRKNDNIKPGVSVKVAYDDKGLIIGDSPLTNSDIPNIEIEKINGLKEVLLDKANKSDLRNIKLDLDTIFESRDITGTGCKVNYDKYGVIQSSSELLESDIPRLSINHIIDLQEKLDNIMNTLQYTSEDYGLEEPNISPNTACKVSYNKYGQIVSSSNIAMVDLPSELISKLNVIESKLISKSNIEDIIKIKQELSKKLDSQSEITPGIFDKVRVDKNGLIIEGFNIDNKDLNLKIDDIDGLYNQLDSKVNRNEFTNLANTVSILVNSIHKLKNIMELENSIDNKVDKLELEDLRNVVNKVNSELQVLSSIDQTFVIDTLLSIKNSINKLDKRLSDIENII